MVNKFFCFEEDPWLQYIPGGIIAFYVWTLTTIYVEKILCVCLFLALMVQAPKPEL